MQNVRVKHQNKKGNSEGSPMRNKKNNEHDVPLEHNNKPEMRHSPLNVPFKRRLETVLILLHSTSILVFMSIYFFCWCIPFLWPLMLYYTVFYYLLDRSPVNGGVWNRRIEFFRNLAIWKHLVGYFPIKFHKTADLKPTFNEDKVRIGPKYIFGYHPHGIIATGVSSGFTNDGASWNQSFNGIKCFVTTLVNQFYVPFYRDYLMALGVTTVVKKNLKLILSKGGSIVIVVGGAQESLLAKPGLNSLVLNKRKGFIKLALESIDDEGVCVVPVYGFGENDVYNVFYTDVSDQKESQIDDFTDKNLTDDDFKFNSFNFYSLTSSVKKYLRNFQLFLKNNYGWTLPIVISRGIFNYDFGLLPYRRPINVVFGKPIQIKRLNGLSVGDKITEEEINYWHSVYVDELKNVWKWGKPKFTSSNDEDLKIVQ